MKRSGPQSNSKAHKRISGKRPELLAMAKSLGIKGRHRMTKKELIGALGPYLKKSPAFPVQTEQAQPPQASHKTPKRLSYDDLPWSYGETELVLMPVDPFLMHVYWDFSPKDWEEIQVRRESAILRVYDVTMILFDGTNAHSYFDVPITLETQNWYVQLWSAEKSLCADIGWLLPDGSFRLVARSNVIQTPRAGISIFDKTGWIEVRPLSFRQYSRKNYRNRPQKRGPSFWRELQQQIGSLITGGITHLSSRGS